MSLLGAPTHAPPEFTKTDKSKRRRGPQRTPTATPVSRSRSRGRRSSNSLRRRPGSWRSAPPWRLRYHYGPIQIHVGRLQAVHRNPVRLTAHVHHEKLDPGLKHAERSVVGRSQRTSVSIVVHKNIHSLLQPWQDVGPRQPVPRCRHRGKNSGIVQEC